MEKLATQFVKKWAATMIVMLMMMARARNGSPWYGLPQLPTRILLKGSRLHCTSGFNYEIHFPKILNLSLFSLCTDKPSCQRLSKPLFAVRKRIIDCNYWEQVLYKELDMTNLSPFDYMYCKHFTGSSLCALQWEHSLQEAWLNFYWRVNWREPNRA